MNAHPGYIICLELTFCQPWDSAGLSAGSYFFANGGGDPEADLGQIEESETRVASNPLTGRSDTAHGSYDRALVAAREKAGILGEDTEKMYDPETGTLIGERSADGRQGWRIDHNHVNWWNWSEGKKGSGGQYGHEFFPQASQGPIRAILATPNGSNE